MTARPTDIRGFRHVTDLATNTHHLRPRRAAFKTSVAERSALSVWSVAAVADISMRLVTSPTCITSSPGAKRIAAKLTA